jgi:exosome complex component CSL4
MATTTLPTLRFPIGDTVVPGDRLGTIRQVQAGSGTHVQGGHVYATLVGTLQVADNTADTAAVKPQQDDDDDEAEASSTQPPPPQVPTASCWIQEAAAISSNNYKPLATSRVLQVGQLVLGKVLRITPQNALVQVSLVEGVGSPGPLLEGAIRREDIRGGATGEELAIEDCFQPGDMVACRVLSLGDARRYFLSTAETELGVLRAICKASGQMMIPISWKEMQCPETGVKEGRKCAKPGGGGGVAQNGSGEERA